MPLPEQLERFARDRGIAVELEGEIDRLKHDHIGVMVVGSVAEGRYTSASDLDLLVLRTETSRENMELKGEAVHPTGIGSESLGFIKNVELNVEYVAPEQKNALADVMTTYEQSLKLDEQLILPVPDIRQLRLLNRVRGGIVLCGTEIVDSWRTALRIDLLPGFIGVLYFVTALDYLEDAYGWTDRHSLSAFFMGREAAAALTMAYVAFHERTHHDPKWLGYEMDTLEENPATRALRSIWFPSPNTCTPQAYLKAVSDACDSVLRHLDELPSVEAHICFARRYCSDRYRLGIADFLRG